MVRTLKKQCHSLGSRAIIFYSILFYTVEGLFHFYTVVAIAFQRRRKITSLFLVQGREKTISLSVR